MASSSTIRLSKLQIENCEENKLKKITGPTFLKV